MCYLERRSNSPRKQGQEIVVVGPTQLTLVLVAHEHALARKGTDKYFLVSEIAARDTQSAREKPVFIMLLFLYTRNE